VRRRVYDALNVLYAAGVLRKDGKHVSCDPKVLEMTKLIKESGMIDSESRASSIASSADKRDTIEVSGYEMKLKSQIDDLKA